MGETTTAADLRAVLGYAECLLTVTTVSAVESVLLAGLAELVRADAATLHETDLATPRQVTVGWPPGRLTLGLAERLGPLLLSHPFAAVYQRQLAGRAPRAPFRISDLLSRREWRSAPLRTEALTDTDDQLGLVLATRSGTIRNVLLSRQGRSFTDRERDLVALATRHVAVAADRVWRGGAVGLQTMPRAAWVPLVGRTGPVVGPGIPLSVLSAREEQVLALVAAGLTDAQAARRLGLSPRTVSKHLERVYARLGVPNRAAAVVAWAAGQSR
jgi:DNA-binding CsgD family transcriptional regulator